MSETLNYVHTASSEAFDKLMVQDGPKEYLFRNLKFSCLRY